MNRDIVAIGRTSARVRLLPLAAGAAVALASLTPSVLADATWVGNGTAPGNNWNPVSTVNWLGGVGPTSDVTATLNFFQGNAAAVTSTNNIVGTPFQVHSMNFNVQNAFTVAWAAGNKFQFANDGTTAPTIGTDGYGTAILASATTAGIELADNLTFGGSGPGSLTIAGLISETGGSRSITVPSSGLLSDLHILYLANAANSFSGGLIIDGGTFGSAGANALSFGAAASTITVTSNGGTMANQSQPVIAQTALQLNGPLHVILGGMALGNSTTAGSLTNGCLQGTSPLFAEVGTILVKSNSGSGSASPYTGAVYARPSDLPQLAPSIGGAVTLQSLGTQSGNATGSLNMAASFDVQAGGTLTVDNSGSGVTQNGDRIGDTVPVRIRSGLFELKGPSASASSPTSLTETIGDVTGAGEVRIAVSNALATGVIATLQPNSLSRVERGTFVFHGNITLSTLGDGATASRYRVILTNPIAGADFVGGGGAALSTNISILPYAVGGLGNNDRGSSLITYGADGFRLLQPAEYFTGTDLDATPPGATDNVRLTTATAHNGTHTINALVLVKNGTTDGSITGTGTLNITSGAILSGNNTNIINTITNNIAFGAAEAVVTTGLGSDLKLTGNLTGTNGLTKSGGSSGNVLILTGDNSGLTGPLTLNAGVVQVTSELTLPGTGAIVVNGSIVATSGNSTGLFSANPSAWTLSRNFAVNTGIMTFNLTDAAWSSPTLRTNLGSLTIAGAISGVGGVNYQGQTLSTQVTVPADIYVTNTGNTYTGETRFGGGNIHIAADSCTGNGGAWEFTGGTVVLENADLTNSRLLNFSGSTSGFNTNGFNMTLNGPITAYNEGSLTTATGAGINKFGAGTLTLTNTINMIAGPVNVYNGTMLINGVLGPSATNSVFVGTFDAGAHYGTLGGSGTIFRNVTVATGGTLSPGNSGPAILTLYGSLDMGAAVSTAPANLVMELNGPVAGTGYDQVVSILQNGAGAAGVATVKLGAPTTTPATTPANLVLSLGYAPASTDVFWLIVSKSTIGTANLVTGTFAGLPEGSPVTLGTFGGVTYTGLITYNANFETGQLDHSGNDVAIYGISSPTGSCCVLGGGSGGTRCFGGDTAAQCATRGGTYTPGGTCTGPSSCNSGHFCGSVDFNCDGDLGTDSDIAAFFACLAGTCPALPCISTADFNGDGDLGTDADIEAFFRVLSGGSC